MGVDEQETSPEEEMQRPAAEVLRGIVWVYPQEDFLPFVSGRLTLGRDPSASAQLASERVSRLHASIRREGPLQLLRDEGSRNGTRHNGVLIHEVALDDGDVVRIGDWVGVVATIPRSVVQTKQLFCEEAGVVLGPQSQLLWQRAARIAPSSLPVLVEAPTGAGKEVFARALHEISGRAGQLVAQNCAALPEGLAEAQLFGYARGAFTGARESAPGLFVAADRGTLLLDEIVDLPLAQQAKLLRAIEERAVTPLGLTVSRRVDVRLVAASQVSLSERVDQGRFRADLLARLAGATLRISPLRARREESFRLFSKYFHEHGGELSALNAPLAEAVALYDWPLNVREVKLAAHSLVAQFGGSAASAAHFAEILTQHRAVGAAGSLRTEQPSALGTSRERTEQALGSRRAAWLSRNGDELRALREALRVHHGNLSKAAREIAMSRQRAQRLLAAQDELDRQGTPDRQLD